jgi:predicted nucleotidyltransferase
MPFLHTATGMPLDIVLAGSGLEEDFLSRAKPTDIGGTSVPMIDLGDLIIAKVLAGRPKDIADATGLWRLHGVSLDVNRIRATLRLLEEALGQSDLVTAFDAFAR